MPLYAASWLAPRGDGGDVGKWVLVLRGGEFDVGLMVFLFEAGNDVLQGGLFIIQPGDACLELLAHGIGGDDLVLHALELDVLEGELRLFLGDVEERDAAEDGEAGGDGPWEPRRDGLAQGHGLDGQGGEDLGLQAGWRRDLRYGAGERGGAVVELALESGEFGVVLAEEFEIRGLGVGEEAEDVERYELFFLFPRHDTPFRLWRSSTMARRIRLFTVVMGWSSSLAISLWERPRK